MGLLFKGNYENIMKNYLVAKEIITIIPSLGLYSFIKTWFGVSQNAFKATTLSIHVCSHYKMHQMLNFIHGISEQTIKRKNSN